MQLERDYVSGAASLWNEGAACSLRVEPFPYYVKDDVLTEAGLAAMLQYWPEQAHFQHNAGYHRHSLRMQYEEPWAGFDEPRKRFWAAFIRTVARNIITESLDLFAPYIANKYGLDCSEVVLQNFEIVELFDAQLPIHVHAHHFHSPLLIGTCVFYVDDAGLTSRGTTIYRAKEGLGSVGDLARLESLHRSLDLSPDIERFATLDFAPNRAFVMHDNPIGWHKVEDNSALGHIGPRRHLLFNWGLPFALCEKRYGVDLDTYMKIREDEQGSARVRRWLERDIADLKAPCSYTEEQLLRLKRSFKVRGHAALDII